jgi:hypothetical protein
MIFHPLDAAQLEKQGKDRFASIAPALRFDTAAHSLKADFVGGCFVNSN